MRIWDTIFLAWTCSWCWTGMFRPILRWCKSGHAYSTFRILTNQLGKGSPPNDWVWRPVLQPSDQRRGPTLKQWNPLEHKGNQDPNRFVDGWAVSWSDSLSSLWKVCLRWSCWVELLWQAELSQGNEEIEWGPTDNRIECNWTITEGYHYFISFQNQRVSNFGLPPIFSNHGLEATSFYILV